jgi:ubiquinone/menaquinone biosynthesis C-methylase UbiE
MQTPYWFPDELHHAGNEHLDPHYVQGYDQKAGVNVEDDLTILRELGLNKAHTLIDFGAGTGTFALAAAPFCRRVIAVDVSAPMLDALNDKAAQSRVGNIETVQAGFLSYQHQGGLTDFAYSRHALHHLSDFWKALALKRIRETLKPSGIFYLRDLIFSFEPHEAEDVIEAWFSNAALQPKDGWTRGELEMHVREEHSTFSWLLEPMIERAGFKIQDIKYDASRVYAAYTCIKLI